MESDLSLINRIKNGDGGDSLTSLIERHSGIYVYVVDQFTKNPNSLIDRDTIMKEKDHTIFIAALNYNPDCKSKFSTYLANEAKWKCLNAISKAKRRRETSFEDIKNDPASEEDSCQHLIKVESFNFFKNMLNEEKDERVKKIIDIRYNTTNNKLVPWRVVAEKLDMSIQGCINIHNKFIKKVRNELNKNYV
jgi:DNA-directed RNA polymerase specialized sigma24 family protein|tara:strand:- start:3575 stop:4150 length:576 start_codon:yes stop_codon:yes gene_type:complete